MVRAYLTRWRCERVDHNAHGLLNRIKLQVLPDSVSPAEDRGSTLSQFAGAKMRICKTIQN